MKTEFLDICISERVVPCNADVLLWNYWDGEHLIPVHGGYTSASLLYQGEKFSLCLFKTKPPLFPVDIPTIAFVVQHQKYVQMTYALQIILLSKTTIEIKPVSLRECRVSVRYQMLMPRALRGSYLLLKRLVPKWFETVFKEDLPLRIRRQKVLEAGFKDYVGMPAWQNKNGGYDYSFKQPLVPISGSPLLSHPFLSSNHSLG